MRPPLALVLLTVALTACGPGQTGDKPMPTPTPVEVELDLYSGRPNPTWTLTTTQSTELRERLEALPTTASTPPPDNLGYRGFLVRLSTNTPPTRVHRAVHQPDGTTRDAADRTLERWLLDTGRTALPADVVNEVAKELG
ncbi:hypothetical protein JOF53_002719 [Crossiella equi]|uniref:Uncharacterized protein n=2 Tax=Crossiella equi TaxID=130796 RepID=A0ABS5AC29_9PSEU|nr:hypothetical protein [Crossiella equi]MBP2473847.1 hypothetical protein [Crossiella equi]